MDVFQVESYIEGKPNPAIVVGMSIVVVPSSFLIVGDKPHSAKDGVLFHIKPECKQQFVDAIDEYGLKYEVFCEELTSALRKIAESEQYKRI